ncbi:MAG: YhdP family protein [Rhodanobacteraceae bacterium]
MNPWRHRLRRARFFVGALIAAVLIAAAVAVGLMQLLLPLAAHYPDRLAALLSERLHRSVHFDSVRGQWQPSGPLLSVRGLTLGPAVAGGESISLPKAAIKFDFSAWLTPAHRWITLRVSGLELRVVHNASGWRVLGLGNPNETQETPLQSLPVDLDLHVLKVSIDDATTQSRYVLFSPHLRVVNVGGTLRFGGNVVRDGAPQPLTVIGRFDNENQNADIYIAGRDLDLAAMTRALDLQGYAVQSGHGDLELWGSWRGDHPAAFAARFDVGKLAASAPGGQHAQLLKISGVIALRKLVDGWSVRYRADGKPRDDIDDAGGALLLLRGTGNSRRVALAARGLDLAPLLPLAGLMPQIPAGAVDWIVAAQPHGTVDSAALRWNADGRYAAVAHLRALGATPASGVPGVDSLDATLRSDEEALSIELPSQAATLRFPGVFRQPFVLSKLGGTFMAWRDGAQWHVATDALNFDAKDFGGQARGQLILQGAGNKPFLDVYANLTHAAVPAAKLFWPHSLPPATVQWLDRALVSGKVDSGRVLLRGDLDDWPFKNHEGRFDALAHVSDVVFDYADGWPRAQELDANVQFLDTAIIGEATRADVLGIDVTNAVAHIPDLGNTALLTLAVQANGRGAALLDLVRKSPIGRDAASTLSPLTIGGTGKLAMTLVLPLDQANQFTVDGNLQLASADVAARAWNLQLQGVDGPLHFDAKGFGADALKTAWHGAPAALSIAFGDDAADPGHQLEAALTGRFSATTLLQDYPGLAALGKITQGTANFRIGLNIAQGGNADNAAKTLSVQSNLRGIALDLPAPLDKPASTILPMSLQLGLPFTGGSLDLALGDLLRTRGRLPDDASRKSAVLAVAFGDTPPATLPSSGMTLSGHARQFDLGGWAHFATGDSNQASSGAQSRDAGNGLPPLRSAQISADDVLVFGKHLGAQSLRYTAGTDVHTLTLDGALLAGTLSLPDSNLARRGITAQLQRLYWPEDKTPNAEVTPAPDALAGVAPGSLPPLHLSIADLHLGDARLGETHFESAPSATGMHVTRMDMQSKDVQIRSHGDWIGNAQSSRSQFVIDLVSDNLGRMLGAFGFAGLISGGDNARAHIEASWPGAPTAFALANLDGGMKVNVGKGRIPEVQPGVGRLFGLISVRELPRRLTLDFGDVFKSGFGFNSITGVFALADGNARTDDLDIKGPAAEIQVRGRTGLRARDYDQIVQVTPHAGGVLPVVGAVIGGPVGAAAGLAVQGLLGRGLNRAAGARYHIGGSWEKPVITPLSKTVPRATPVQSAPAPPTSGIR